MGTLLCLSSPLAFFFFYSFEKTLNVTFKSNINSKIKFRTTNVEETERYDYKACEARLVQEGSRKSLPLEKKLIDGDEEGEIAAAAAAER